MPSVASPRPTRQDPVEASFAAFGEVIGPATTAAGLDAKPQVFPVEGIVDQNGARTVY
jgi:hypothetical protein